MFMRWFRRSAAITSATPSLHRVRTPHFVPALTRALLVMMIFAIIALAFTPWQQASVISGRIIAFDPSEREQSVDAPIKGRVVEWMVREGDVVKKGDPLVKLGDNDPQYFERLTEQRDAIIAERDASIAAQGDTQQKLESLKKVRELTMSSMDSKISMVRREVEAARYSLDAAKGQLTAMEQNLARKEALFEQGLTAQRELELARMKQIKEKANLAKAQAKVKEYESKVLALRAERASKASENDAKISETAAKLQSERAKAAKAAGSLSKAQTAISRQEQMLVLAPRDGVIWRVLSPEGSGLVKQGDTLARLVPHTRERSVEAWVSGNDAPLIAAGRQVRMQFEGYPALQFSGWPDAAMGTFGGVVSFVDARAEVDGRFRVVIKQDPDAEPWPPREALRQGSRVQGWVLLDTVSLGYEIWRQLNGFPPSVTDDAKKSMAAGKKKSKEGQK